MNEENVRIVALANIKPDPNQPRKHFSDKDVANLAENMRTECLIHPIEVDKDMVIIVGERRYRAATLLGWDSIKVSIHTETLTPYERLRRQMSENLHQSAAKNGESMNPLDTANGWARLYELKTGKRYQPGLYPGMGKGKGGTGLKGPLLEIAEEVAAEKQTVWEIMGLLNEPKLVQEAIADGLPRTYIREANKAPEDLRDDIKDKIVSGDYKSRDEIMRDVALAKKIPNLAQIELERKKSKESSATNKILNGIVNLALALENQPFENVAEVEKGIVLKQLEWLQKEVEAYLLIASGNSHPKLRAIDAEEV